MNIPARLTQPRPDAIDHGTRYDLMTTEQAPPSVVAEWLREPGFAAYVAERRKGAAMNRPALLPSPPLPVERTMSAAEYERLVNDIRENARAYLAAQGVERPSRRLIQLAFLDAWLNECLRHDALHQAIGHLRDAERFAPGSEDEADCINDFAAAAHRAAREHGRDGEP